MKQKIIFIIAALILLALFIIGTLAFKNNQQSAAQSNIQVNQEALMRMHSPIIGAQNAKVTIVEFIDPACEACAAFYPFVKELMAKNPEQIRLVMRYAPLHQGADQVIAVLEAARKQGKYWPALEIVLATQDKWTQNHQANANLVLPLLAPLGLDMAQLQTDMQSDSIQMLIQQEKADAQALGVNKTPSYFVNGKPLQSFGYQQLSDLVNEALNQ
ncbi:DsbA family protein [Iodobacter fluviatilis]|uniref:Protein-disulfide isomerase n=1 Tax=Iodobacter fluviatilis TaxID=537 RepID=A0A377QBI8_9NEIS|nr:thioredoxin domain-containing protein [Iodobacter fluviatilis]TCU81388.1 thioredoxin-like protein [Iodobacter fluviatilis]STQ91969.1 Protein-disulfide isomerase [Iodobacter fluviatilis]